jgi:hypothetical protein
MLDWEEAWNRLSIHPAHPRATLAQSVERLIRNQ